MEGVHYILSCLRKVVMYMYFVLYNQIKAVPKSLLSSPAGLNRLVFVYCKILSGPCSGGVDCPAINVLDMLA